MLEVKSHKYLKKYYQNNLALWPHNLTLTRLISRSLSRKANTFIQYQVTVEIFGGLAF